MRYAPIDPQLFVTNRERLRRLLLPNSLVVVNSNDLLPTNADGTLGLSSLFNTSARATTSADKLAIAGSINVVVFTNVAESIVHSGAKINQDPFYRPSPDFYTNPDHDPTVDNISVGCPGANIVGCHSANANNVPTFVRS